MSADTTAVTTAVAKKKVATEAVDSRAVNKVEDTAEAATTTTTVHLAITEEAVRMSTAVATMAAMEAPLEVMVAAMTDMAVHQAEATVAALTSTAAASLAAMVAVELVGSVVSLDVITAGMMSQATTSAVSLCAFLHKTLLLIDWCRSGAQEPR